MRLQFLRALVFLKLDVARGAYRRNVTPIRCDRTLGFWQWRCSVCTGRVPGWSVIHGGPPVGDRPLSPYLANGMADLRFYDRLHIPVIIDALRRAQSPVLAQVLARGEGSEGYHPAPAIR